MILLPFVSRTRFIAKKCFPLALAVAVLAVAVALVPSDVLAQSTVVPDDYSQGLSGDGWKGFLDLAFIGRALLALVLAAVLGAATVFLTRGRRTVDTIEKAEAPKVYIVYSVVGAIIGLMVLRYGHGMGFVIFGIGGLLRFRTLVRAPHETGRVIFVTLIGLSCGLDLPHIAVLVTLFGLLLINILDSQITYRIVVKGLHKHDLADVAEAYRDALESAGCRLLGERKRFSKSEVVFVFRASHRSGRRKLEHRFEHDIPDNLRGAVDWEIG